MPSALPPDLAIAYVTELSADIAAAVMLDSEGEWLAGPASLAAPAKTLAKALGHGISMTTSGAVLVARGDDRTLVVAFGPRAFPAPSALDALTAVGGGSDLPERPATAAMEAAAQALVTTAEASG